MVKAVLLILDARVRKDDDWGCVTVRDFPPMSPFKLAPFYNRLQRMNQTEFPVTVEYDHKKPFL